ncbi:hypothetical protein NKH93_29400 [Mesorhizobium sp. M0954]|uniref:hypothetical protein n=1 Tax=Mesorhizobium sp. M0954 TaxID=2957032 RepID=UPI00333C2843
MLNTLTSHTLGVGMPAAIQWQGHKAVERQDLAFFHDLYAGQVASRLPARCGPISSRRQSRCAATMTEPMQSSTGLVVWAATTTME